MFPIDLWGFLWPSCDNIPVRFVCCHESPSGNLGLAAAAPGAAKAPSSSCLVISTVWSSFPWELQNLWKTFSDNEAWSGATQVRGDSSNNQSVWKTGKRTGDGVSRLGRAPGLCHLPCLPSLLTAQHPLALPFGPGDSGTGGWEPMLMIGFYTPGMFHFFLWLKIWAPVPVYGPPLLS